MSDFDFERVTHFPVKLWDVVNDEASDIFRWSDDGESFFVDDHKYEREIMQTYPGFVQIPSFANLRRLLREYSFSWQTNDTGEFQFSHPGFKRGDKDQILFIRTKRKATQAANGQVIKIKMRRRHPSDYRSTKSPAKAWLQPAAANTAVNLRVDTLLRFPEKLWEVVNDTNDLLYWSDDGETVIVDDKKYEEEIMSRYPGFVKCNTFNNLRRLLREYGFSWSIHENGFFKFSHSHMKRGHPELLKGVKTKRKALKAGSHHPYLPFFKAENAIPGVPPSKCYNGHFDRMDMHCQSSPEVNQAVGAIHQGIHSEGRDMHCGSGDVSVPSHHIYSFHPYRMMPPHQPVNHLTLHQGHIWQFHGHGEKMEPNFSYSPAWNDGQIPCNPQAYDPPVQLSPSIAQGSNSEMQASSTGSSESVYACTSKSSPAHALDDQVHDLSPLPTPTSFQSIDGPSSGYNGSAFRYTSVIQEAAYCEPNVYQPLYSSTSTYPTNQQNGAGDPSVIATCIKQETTSTETSPATSDEQRVPTDQKMPEMLSVHDSEEQNNNSMKLKITESSNKDMLAELLEDEEDCCSQLQNQVHETEDVGVFDGRRTRSSRTKVKA